jgi:hypothetical protein
VDEPEGVEDAVAAGAEGLMAVGVPAGSRDDAVAFALTLGAAAEAFAAPDADTASEGTSVATAVQSLVAPGA